MANHGEERVVRAPCSNVGTGSNQQKLERGTEKEMAPELNVSWILSRTKAGKIKKTPITPPVQRRLQGPVIIHSSPPKVIRTDPSNFMWLVQKLTGSSKTRSRCKKDRPHGADDLMKAQTDTPVEFATAKGVETVRTDQSNFTSLVQKLTGSSSTRSRCETRGVDDLTKAQTETVLECGVAAGVETELFLPEDTFSQTSSDDEELVPIQTFLEKAVPGFPGTPNAFSFIDDASPRGPLPSSSLLFPAIAADESNFTTFPFSASSFQFSSYPVCPDITAEHFTVPILEPIWDSFVCPCSLPRDSSFSSLSDLPLLSPSRLDGFIS